MSRGESMENEQLRSVVALRADLQWSQFTEGNDRRWVARDPIALEHYYFSDLERGVLEYLDGTRTLSDVLISPTLVPINSTWLLGLIRRLAAAGLLATYQQRSLGHLYWRKTRLYTARTRLTWLLNPLTIRIPLLDPTWLLEFLSPLAGLLFSRALARIVLVLAPIITFLVVQRLLSGSTWTQLQESLVAPTAEQVLTLMVTYLILKGLHELGHALACRKWGAECHEIGVMLLVFMPVLYCDTTDSWKLTSHWRRAAVAMGGIYMELILAMVAGAIWLLAVPEGTVHNLAGYVMLVGSVNSVLVNLNPLLRYDGYYAASDLLKIPNLADQSKEALQKLSTGLLTGVKLPAQQWDGPQWLLVTYGISSLLFRTVLLFVILGFVWVTLDRLGLRIFALFIWAVCLAKIVQSGVKALSIQLKLFGQAGHVRWARVLIAISFLALLVWLVGSFQWTKRVSARAVTEFAQFSPVYAQQSGELLWTLESDAKVVEGQEVIRLSSDELAIEKLQLAGELRQLEERFTELQLSQVSDDSVVYELGNVAEQRAKLRTQNQLLSQQYAALAVTAPHAGLFVRNRQSAALCLTSGNHLANWNPVYQTANLGSQVERGSLIGWVTRSDEFRLVAILPEHDARLVSPGLAVRCKWDCEPSQVYSGVVHQVSAEPKKETPLALVGDVTFRSVPTDQGLVTPIGTHYEVIIHMDHWPRGTTHQSVATAYITTGHSTLWQELNRYFLLNIRPQFVNQNR